MSGYTDNGLPYIVNSDDEVEITVGDLPFEVYLTEMDLRLMLRKVERAKANPSGRSVEEGS